MTEQQAHEILHEALPNGSTVSISHNSWSHSTVGPRPVVVRSNSWEWHVVVTVPNEADHHAENAFGANLADAVSQVLELVRPHVHGRPAKIAAPSVGVPDPERKRDAS